MIQDFNLALHTDLYQLTMAYSYFKKGVHHKKAVFHHFFRKKPFGGEYAIFAGLEQLIQFVAHFRFTSSDIEYLASLKDGLDHPLFDADFLNFLKDFRFDVDIEAVEEGTVVFPYEPLIRVTGSILQAQLLESPLLNIINFQTIIATKASRIMQAAQDGEVVEFGLRRAQGLDGALSASRAAFIGGASSTSNVLAGKQFGIPVKGTHAHSFVMFAKDEKEAFLDFAKYMPGNAIFLVDTYDSIQATKKAIEVAKEKGKDFAFLGVRLDSGDLAQLSIQIRKLLDGAGFYSTKIMASNELDEFIIRDLKQQGARIDIWGVGTALSTAKGQPALDGVYKLACYEDEKGEWKRALKISEQPEKVTNPGILEVRRFFNDEGNIADMIFDLLSPPDKETIIIHPVDPIKKKRFVQQTSYEDLLKPIFRQGDVVYSLPSIFDIQKKAKGEIAKFHPSMMRFLYPSPYFVGLEQGLFERKLEMIHATFAE